MQEPIETNHPKKSSGIIPKIILAILIIIFVFLCSLLYKAYAQGSKIFTNHISFIKRVQSLVSSDSVTLQGEEQNQINVLLLGYGGVGHDGPYLTDSMILATINPQTNKILLTSIPRDYLWDPNPDSPKKINSAFAYGLGQNGDFEAAGSNARQAVEQLTGLNIPYFVGIDFSGFVKAIDRVGGVDIMVDRSFTDSAYPDSGTGYLPPQHFDAGMQHMNGTKALIFARSRHGNNDEGSDFARSKRQAKIIKAFEDKIREQNLLANPSTANDLFNIVSDHLHTNMEPGEILHLEKILHDGADTVSNVNLDPSTNLLCENRLTDQYQTYVIEKCPGITRTDISDWLVANLNGNGEALIKNEGASLIIENAGTDANRFMDLKKTLENAGISVYIVSYKGLPVSNSSLYEINSKPNAEQFIESKLGIQHQPKPASMTAKTDLVLIVGTDY